MEYKRRVKITLKKDNGDKGPKLADFSSYLRYCNLSYVVFTKRNRLMNRKPQSRTMLL